MLSDNFFALGDGTVVPEPPLHDRRAVGRGARQPVAAVPEAARTAGGRVREVVGMRHRRRRLRRGRRSRGGARQGRSVLRLPHRGRPAEPGPASRGRTTRRRTRRSATSGPPTRRSTATAATRSCGLVTSGRSTTSSATSRRTASRRSRGSPRASSSPSTPSTTSATGMNWSVELVNAIMRSPACGGHGDLPHVGRLRRLLRPRRRRTTVDRFGFGIRVPTLVISSVREAGARRQRRGRVLERPPLHRGQLGPALADGP